MKDFWTLLKLTLWCAGLLLSLMLGMGSAYIVGSGVWFSARLAMRFRSQRLEG